MATRVCGIYVIQLRGSTECYVGSSRDIRQRHSQHRCDLKKGVHTSSALQAAWDIHGADAFVFEILEHCKPEFLIEREQHFIDTLDSCLNGKYLATGVTLEQAAKIRDKHVARISSMSQEERRALAKKPPGFSETMREARKHYKSPGTTGKTYSDESRARMSAAQKVAGMTRRSRGPHSAETKAKMRARRLEVIAAKRASGEWAAIGDRISASKLAAAAARQL